MLILLQLILRTGLGSSPLSTAPLNLLSKIHIVSIYANLAFQDRNNRRGRGVWGISNSEFGGKEIFHDVIATFDD
jgi:hypothetical protein